MRLITSYLRPYFGRMAFGFAIKFIGSIMDLFIPMLLSFIIDDIVPTGSVRNIYLAGLLMLICSLIAIAGNIIGAWLGYDEAAEWEKDLELSDVILHVADTLSAELRE